LSYPVGKRGRDIRKRKGGNSGRAGGRKRTPSHERLLLKKDSKGREMNTWNPDEGRADGRGNFGEIQRTQPK